MAAKRRSAVRFSAAAKRRWCCVMLPLCLRITFERSVLLVLYMHVVIEVKCTATAVLQSLDRHCACFPPNSTVHIQPAAARVNTDTQKPLQLLSAVFNAHCTFHKHAFPRRVNTPIISVNRFLGHPVFITECEGCYSRAWRTSLFKVGHQEIPI